MMLVKVQASERVKWNCGSEDKDLFFQSSSDLHTKIINNQQEESLQLLYFYIIVLRSF